MEAIILLIGIVNIVTTVWVGSKILRLEKEPIQVVFLPLSQEEVELEPQTAEEEPVNSVTVNTAPVPPASNGSSGAWINRKGIPLNESYKPAEPPAKHPEGYGYAR